MANVKMNYLILLVIIKIAVTVCLDPIVDTMYGRLQGEVQELNQRQYTTFYGIPYAAPPVGDLRFKPPERHPGWGASTRNAQSYGAACTHLPGVNPSLIGFPPDYFTITQSEDCLFLNVFVPGNISNVEDRSLPVIVFIHGGGFIAGHSQLVMGDAFVAYGEPIIAVTIQYRLGIMGFLTTGDDVVTGNLGFKDQNLALQWIQENIAQFGGDPNRVTICGESGGAESVLAHMVSPMSRGLFQKASATSSPPAFVYPKKETLAPAFRRYAESMDCFGDSQSAIECLRTKPWQEVVASFLFPTTRVVDGDFITEEPQHSWENNHFNDAELMIGFCNDDGLATIEFNLRTVNFTTDRSQDLQVINDLIPFLLTRQISDCQLLCPTITRDGNDIINFDDLYTVIKSRYYDYAETELEKARGILDGARDGYFASFNLFVANQVAKHQGEPRVFVFEHSTELLGLSIPGGLQIGAVHGSDLIYLHGYGLLYPDVIPLTDDELELTHSFIKAWSSFAAGSPSYLSMSGEEIDWEAFTESEPTVLVLDTNMSQESLSDASQTWQPVLDFWLAIESLAQFEDDSMDPPPNPPTDSALAVVCSMFNLALMICVNLLFM